MTWQSVATDLEIAQTVDEEDITLPVAPAAFTHVGHPLAHFDRGVDGLFEHLCEIFVVDSVTLVHEGSVVHGYNLAQDLGRVAQCQWRGEGGVWRVEKAEHTASLRFERLEECGICFAVDPVK